MAPRLTYLRCRYLLDRAAAGGALVVLSPLLAVIALLVLVSSGRPVLFAQQRVGRDGVDFEILKFRTMVRDAERLGGGYMPDGMNLVTPVGRVLRRTSLDELPQLLNIARGDMAIIGPRPTLRDQFERYTSEQRRRTAVLPGVTGLAQVTYRNAGTWTQRIVRDVEYIDRASPWLDAKILAMTVTKVFRGEGVLEGQTAADVDDLGPRDVS